MNKNIFVLIVTCIFLLGSKPTTAQVAECPYPIIFMHGWTGSNESWEDFYSDANANAIWGSFDTNDHVFWAMPNAEDTHAYDCCTFICAFQCIEDNLRNDNINGQDGVWSNNGTGDDVQWVFPNENNALLPGCMYAYSFNVGKNNDGTIFKNPTLTSTAPCNNCSDNNESAATKQGYAVKKLIETVLAANPTKDKVVLVGHSMGGLAGREYIQRTDGSGNPKWWQNPNDPSGHRVAKFVTLGTPHRGSNTAGNLLKPMDEEEKSNQNSLPDLYSEGVRDLRYSVEDGSLGDDIPGVYMFGGQESSIPTFGGRYHSHDVNCDGDDGDIITGINISGLAQGFTNVWDGTVENPIMPLPQNLKYTYYVSDGDGVVDDTRQWLYLNGNGDTPGYNSGASISVPHDGVDHRLSDRHNSSLFHTSENSDVNGIARLLDEGDYPQFAWDVTTRTWYLGTVQQRAEKVPVDSEYTLSANNLIDGDWYVYELIDTAYQISVDLIPHTAVSGRLDVYESVASAYDNTNSLSTLSWTVGTVSTLTQITPVKNYLPGTYYVRITHDVSSFGGASEDVWKTPYTFKIDMIEECENVLHIDNLQVNATYEVGQVITSDATIVSGNDVKYFAGSQICLQNQFETESNTVFTAEIRPCVVD